MPYICAFSLFMVLAGLTLPRTSGASPLPYPPSPKLTCTADYSLKYYFLLWCLIFFLSFFYIRAHGVEYVSWPRLNPLDDVIYYDGPGFRSRKVPKHPAYQSASVRGRLTTSKPQRIGMEEIEMGHYGKKRTD
jgi:phosphatidylinositol 4-phosphatase